MTDKPSYQYVTYIEATPEAVWEALTDPDLTGEYWGHRNIADPDWTVGSSWTHARTDASGFDGGGTILESDPPHRLVFDWGNLEEEAPEMSRVTFTIQPHGGIVRLTVLHEELMNQEMLESISGGWPAVFSNLKSLLETGSILPTTPWEVPA